MARLINSDTKVQKKKPQVLAAQSLAKWEWMDQLSLREVDA